MLDKTSIPFYQAKYLKVPSYTSFDRHNICRAWRDLNSQPHNQRPRMFKPLHNQEKTKPLMENSICFLAWLHLWFKVRSGVLLFKLKAHITRNAGCFWKVIPPWPHANISIWFSHTIREGGKKKKIIKKRTSHKKVPKSCDLLIVKYQGPPSHVDTTVLCTAKARGPPLHAFWL